MYDKSVEAPLASSYNILDGNKQSSEAQNVYINKL